MIARSGFVVALVLLGGWASAAASWPDAAQLASALRSQNAADRRLALDELEPLSSSEAEPLLVAALGDSDVQVRRAAILALGRRRSPVAPVLRSLLTDADATIRTNAATALGQVPLVEGDAALTQSLAAALKRSLGDPEISVRRAAIETLASRPALARHVHPALVGCLADAEPVIRQAAAVALGRLGAKSAVILLIARAGDPSRDVRTAAATALGALGDSRAQSAVLRLLFDPVDEVRIAAARGLGQLGAGLAVPALGALFESHTASDALRAHAAFSLARIAARIDMADSAVQNSALDRLCDGLARPWLASLASEALTSAGAAALPALYRRLDDARDAPSQIRVLRLIAQLGDARAVAPVKREIERDHLPHPELASAAATLSIRLDAHDAAPLQPFFKSWLRSGDAQVRRAAAHGLSASCGSECADTWLALSDDPDGEVRRIALAGLGSGPAEKTRGQLEARLRGNHEELAMLLVVTDALGRLGDRRSSTVLGEALQDSRPTLRRRAVAALIRLWPRSAAPPTDPALLDALLHQLRSLPAHDERRIENIRALGLLARPTDGAVRDLLLELAEQHTATVAQEAVDALAALGDDTAVPRLRTLVRSTEPLLRLRVVQALAVLGRHMNTIADREQLARLLVNRLDSDSDLRVRAEAAWSLGILSVEIPGEADALSRAGLCPDAAVRTNVAATLSRRGHKAALAALAHDADPFVRANAASPRTTAPVVGPAFLLIDLVDFDGAGLPAQALRLRLSDGLYKVSFTDARGAVREEAVPSGPCTILSDAELGDLVDTAARQTL